MNEAAQVINDLVDPSVNLIFGAVIDPTAIDVRTVTKTLLLLLLNRG